MTAVRLPDQDARDAVIDHRHRSLFVEAGAGAGKTHQLVARIVALVVHDDVPVGAVAAITFTEKAAAELRDRVREELGRHAADPQRPVEAARATRALVGLDAAAIGTLHGFAQRLLLAHPVEAGIPPLVEVLDEVASSVAFQERWVAMRRRLLDDPDTARSVLLARALGVPLDRLADLAAALDDNWDLLHAQLPDASAGPPGPLADRIAAVVHEARAAAAVAAVGPPGDTMVQRLTQIGAWAERVDAAPGEAAALELLADAPSWAVGTCGRAADWDRVGRSSDGDRTPPLAQVRAQVVHLGERVQRVRAAVADAVARHLTGVVGHEVLLAADERRRAGTLQFHDLLVLARLVVQQPDVRRTVHQQYRHLLLDEFQDTDPIQLDLAVRIAAPPEAEGTSWADLPVAPGRLFVVGDPKQSIYRFRRADVGLYQDAARRSAADRVDLSANFRSAPVVVQWVNDTFAPMFASSGAGQVPFATQVAIRADSPVGSVRVIDLPCVLPGTTFARELMAAEADQVAATIAAMHRDGTEVIDGARRRPMRLGDVAVLVPTRTSLDHLLAALDRHGLDARVDASSLVYEAPEIRDLLLALRAVDDPSDGFTLVHALRSTLYGCTDPDLVRYRHHGGTFHLLAPAPDHPEALPVAEAITHLRSLHHAGTWLEPGALLERLATERMSFEAAVVSGRPRDAWRRLRFVIDQARAWSDTTGGSLRQYLQWVAAQATPGARVVETVLPETDHDAVRILTVHAAKGLEFPVVAVSGCTTAPRTQRGPVQVLWHEGRVAVRLGKDVSDTTYEEQRPIDEQLSHDERVRLLYVACTRARDHLVVSAVRKTSTTTAATKKGAPAAPKPDAGCSLAELVARHAPAAHRVAAVDPGRGTHESGTGGTGASTHPAPDLLGHVEALPPFEQWDRERAEAVARAARQRTVGATTLAHGWVPGHPTPTDDGDDDRDPDVDPGLAKAPRDLDLPPWRRGRYGTAVGRAVHGSLQLVDLATAAGLDGAVAAQCAAEGVEHLAHVVHALAAAALRHPVVQEAAALPHWRETYVGAPLEGVVVEGYVDLLYRTDAGLVVVDYKTDHVPTVADRAARVERYAVQLGAYACVLETATGLPVHRAVLVFCTPQGAVAESLEGAALDAARQAARSEAAKGTLVPPGAPP